MWAKYLLPIHENADRYYQFTQIVFSKSVDVNFGVLVVSHFLTSQHDFILKTKKYYIAILFSFEVSPEFTSTKSVFESFLEYGLLGLE